jgi:Cof subfamily protein (haloacid dehalogenase superfamily)
MKFRALCTDIDGTLLDSRRELSPRTIAAIKNLDKDIPVILASSRMPSAMRHLQHELGILNHPLISFNGGYVIHFENRSLSPDVLDTVFVPPTICAQIITLTKGTDIHISLYFEDNWYAPSLDQWAEREERITKVSPSITSLNAVIDHWHETSKGAHKVMCMGPAQEIDQLEKELNKKFINEIHVYRSRDTYIEIAPRAISKASGLALILKKHYDIDLSEVMAFGDNYNDIDLLSAAGMGIAVGNARDEVKAVAKEITLNSKDDGVAIAIEKYLHT